MAISPTSGSTKLFLLAAIMLVAGVFCVHAQWKRVNLPGLYNDRLYLDIMFLPSNPIYGWACSHDGHVIRTLDGGRTWTGTAVPGANDPGPNPDPGGPSLESVSFTSPLNGFVSGPAGIWRTLDGGVSWENVTPGAVGDGQGWGCYFYSNTEGVYLVGGCDGDGQKFFRTTNAGESWTQFRGNVSQSGLSDAMIYTNGRGYASSSGIIWTTDDYGVRWRQFAVTGALYWQEEITNIGASFLVPSAGSTCTGGGGEGEMRFTTDNGKTWTRFNTNASMFGSFMINETTGWGVGVNKSVYYTEDAGATWILRNCGVSTDLDDCWFVNDTTGWLAGFGLYKSDFNPEPIVFAIDPPQRVLTICEGESVELFATEGYSNYHWSDNVNASKRTVSKAGFYVVSAYDARTCTLAKDTIEIKLHPSYKPVIIASKPVVCFGDSVTLSVSGPYKDIVWNTGEKTASILVKQSGTYTVTTVDTNGCANVSTPYTVDIKPEVKPTISANNRLTICVGDSVVLTAPAGFALYEWSNGSSEQSIVVTTDGTFTVHVVDQFGCEGTSNPATVTVLNVKNKIEVVRSGNSEVEIESQSVGGFGCTDITIRNVSENENLVISTPYLIQNVVFSVPLSQLPIVIKPHEVRVLRVCAAVIDSGYVRDTLVLPDTCSPTLVPLVSYGKTIEFAGNSKCNTPVLAVVFHAGATYQLHSVWPMPVDKGPGLIKIGITSPHTGLHAPFKAYIVDALGKRMSQDYDALLNDETALDAGDLVAGAYYVVVSADNIPVQTLPFVVVP